VPDNRSTYNARRRVESNGTIVIVDQHSKQPRGENAPLLVKPGEVTVLLMGGNAAGLSPYGGGVSSRSVLRTSKTDHEPLALRWDDVSLDKGTAITGHDDNKGKRDELVPLHPVIEQLRKLVDFGPAVFPWPHHEQSLYVEFARIQLAATDENGERIINLPCRAKHEHTKVCHLYGFHDRHRAFATENALRLSENALQALMRHKSYLTTQKHINMAHQLDRA
jgi:hypothetical protein